MSETARQRIDIWLYRARFTKTRAAASRLIMEGGVRLARQGLSRRLEKPSIEVECGDLLLLPTVQGIRTVRVERLGPRRGPPAEARTLFCEVDADALA